MLKTYYRLTKPGIIYGNVMTAAAGFLLASKGHVDFLLLVATLAGIALVIACGCVLNNYIDRGIDAKMGRTKNRALVTGEISGRQALVYAGVLGATGLLLIVLFVNWLVVGLGVAALFSYVVLYGIAKRRTVHGTLVGTIPGALPLVAGYAAATGRLDAGALLLFVILACWQMPHFYAIAMFRQKDYAAAGLPVMPVKRGIRTTRVQLLLYVVGFALAASALTIFGYAGYSYLVVMLVACGLWLRLAAQGFAARDTTRWARKLFGFSLLVLLLFSLMISLAAWLP